MLTKVLHIKSISQPLDEYFYQATGLHQKLYNNLELGKDKDFIKACLMQFNLFDKSMFDSSFSEVETIYKQRQTIVKNKHQEIDDIIKQLSNDGFKTTREKRHKYKLINKLANLYKTIDKDITFGGKSKLRSITKYSQQIQFGKLTDTELNEKQKLLDTALKDYKQARTSGIYLIGRACKEK